MAKFLFILAFILPPTCLWAQYVDTIANPGIKQIDLIDIGERILNKNYVDRTDVVKNKKGRIHLSVFPAVGYTLQTGFAGVLSANVAFFTTDHNHENENISTIVTSVAYTAKEQFIFPIASSIWTQNNEFNILTDWRYLKYPSETFGLGGYTQQDSFYTSGLLLYKTAPGHFKKNGY